MKIRNGFVSNSSSSSFIVGFKKVPKTQGELLDMMFPKGTVDDVFGDEYIGYASAGAIVARVWSDIQMRKPAKVVEISRELESYVVDYVNDREDHTKTDAIDKKYKAKYGQNSICWDHEDWKKEYEPARNKEWAGYYKKLKALARKFKEENWKKLDLEGKKIYIFEYSDNSGEAALEHGDIFGNLPHIQVSHH